MKAGQREILSVLVNLHQDLDSAAFGKGQFFSWAIIRLRSFHLGGNPLHTVVWVMMRRLILLVGHSFFLVRVYLHFNKGH